MSPAAVLSFLSAFLSPRFPLPPSCSTLPSHHRLESLPLPQPRLSPCSAVVPVTCAASAPQCPSHSLQGHEAHRLMKGGVSNGWTQGAQVSIQSSPTEADLPLPVWKSKVEDLGEVLGGKQQLASEIQGELQPLWTWLPFMKNPTPPTLETPTR